MVQLPWQRYFFCRNSCPRHRCHRLFRYRCHGRATYFVGAAVLVIAATGECSVVEELDRSRESGCVLLDERTGRLIHTDYIHIVSEAMSNCTRTSGPFACHLDFKRGREEASVELTCSHPMPLAKSLELSFVRENVRLFGHVSHRAVYVGHGKSKNVFEIEDTDNVIKITAVNCNQLGLETQAFGVLAPQSLSPHIMMSGKATQWDINGESKIKDWLFVVCRKVSMTLRQQLLKTDIVALDLILCAAKTLVRAAVLGVIVGDCHADNIGILDGQVVILDAGDREVVKIPVSKGFINQNIMRKFWTHMDKVVASCDFARVRSFWQNSHSIESFLLHGIPSAISCSLPVQPSSSSLGMSKARVIMEHEPKDYIDARFPLPPLLHDNLQVGCSQDRIRRQARHVLNSRLSASLSLLSQPSSQSPPPMTSLPLPQTSPPSSRRRQRNRKKENVMDRETNR